MSQQLRMGLLGAGRIGLVHAEAIATKVGVAKLVMVADPALEAAAGLGEKYNIPYTTEPESVFSAPEIDAVAICSPTATHSKYITAAAQAGKHIFCEKPIDHDLDRIDAALAAVEASGVKLMVGFNRRFDANFAQMREMISAGQVGTPQILRITSRDPAPPPIDYIKVSGGLFLDMTIHDFDMARFLMDSEVTEVYVAGAVLVDPAIGEAGDIDTAVITLKFANGALGMIDNSRQAVYGYDQRAEMFGSAGMVHINNEVASTAVFSGAEGIVSQKPLYFFLERYLDAYAAEMAAFVDCVIDDTKPPVTGADGRAPVVIGKAAWKSYQEKRPVFLSEIDG